MIPNSKRTPSELREITQKGGKASGVARRRKKTFKQLMSCYLELQPADPELKNKLQQSGVDPEDITNKALLVQSMFNTAVGGDVNAAKLVMSMIAEDIQHEEFKLKQKEFKHKLEAKQDDNAETLQKLDEVLEKMTGGAE
ncbi:MAG: hypothetical protein MJ095_02165 [Oscillospiraceae bacterium]|nr:hypothetical protein [Oscillospiraceae bacterium]